MANELRHPQSPTIVIDTSTAKEDPHVPNGWNYSVVVRGRTVTLPTMQINPADLEAGIADSDSPVYATVGAALRNLASFEPEPDRGIVPETIIPALQFGVGAQLPGAPVDLMNALTRVAVDYPINFAKWASSGFTGDIPSDRYASAQEPIGGSEWFAKRYEDVSRGARTLREAADEQGLTVNIPIPFTGRETGEFGLQDLLRVAEFDMSPNESTKARQYASLIAKLVAGAPVEGAAIANLAVQLAKTARNPTYQEVLNAVSELQRTKPITAATYEAGMGAGVAAGMITSVEALKEAWPDAPPWVESLVMAGGGIGIPIGAATGARTLWDAGINIWPLKYPLQLIRGITESVTPSGARKAGARAIQSFGGDWRDRGQILGVFEHLDFALSQGRNIDRATSLRYTLPQMARNEATVLDAQLNAALRSQNPPTEAEVTAAKEKIAKLRLWSNVQEGQLKTLVEGNTVGAQVYIKYAEKMLDRRDLIFESLDNAILRLDQSIGGRSSEGVDPAVIEADYASGSATDSYQYTENIKRAIAEGRGGTLDPEQLKAIKEAFAATTKNLESATEGALSDAARKARIWRESLPEDMSAEQRAFFNEQISRDIETAYQEIDFYEDMMWNAIGGLDRPKTGSYISPDGTDRGPQILIGDVPVGEYFAAKVANLKTGERENQSKWLWKLAGRDALAEQAATGKGPDAEKIAGQNLEVKTAEKRLDEAQIKLNRATKTLAELQEPKPTRVRRGLYNYKSYVIEHMTRARGGDDQWNITGPGQTAADDAANTLADSVAFIDSTVTQPKLDRAISNWEKSGDAVRDAQNRLDASRGKLEISLGKGVTDRDVEVNLADEIIDKSELGVQMVDDVPVGRSAQEVNNVIGHLKRELSYEQNRGPLKNSPKIRAIGQMIDDLQGAIPENFNVDPDALQAARNITAFKKDTFEKGVTGKLRGFTRTAEPRVEPEQIINLIAPGAASTGAQDVALRELQTALTPIVVGDETPFRVIGVNEAGRPLVEIDASFNLSEYAASPPPPFERITRGGRSAGYKVIEGTPVTDKNIETVRKALWDRFKIFGSGKTFDKAAAAQWMEQNKEAIGWLKRATPDEPTGFEELASAERVVKALEETNASNINRTIETLREEGAFTDVFTEQGFREILESAAQRDSNLASAAIFLDAPDPLTLGRTFLTNYLKTSNPTDFLRQTLRSLENGALDDGTNPALFGFKQAVAEELLRRGLTERGGNTQTAKDADELSKTLGYDVKLWDADALVGMADNPKFQKLLGDLYGGHAPDMFRKIAEGAQKQNYISRAAARGIKVQDKFSGEVAGNIGRMIGGYASKSVFIPVSGLVLTGMGRRYGRDTVENIRGLAAEKQIVDFLMNPELGIAAATEFPLLSPAQDARMRDRFKLWAHYNFIGRNSERLKRMGQAPGILYEVGEPTKYEEILEEETAPQSSLDLGPPTMASRTPPAPARPLVAGSTLAQASPFDRLAARPPQQLAAATTQGAPNPETAARLAEVGLPLFPAFASKGGLASLKKKKNSRQMVY